MHTSGGMRTHQLGFGMLLLSLLAPGCGDAEPEEVTASELRVGTFNSGLALHYEDWVTEREPVVAAALASEAASLDVLCVQEYWLGDHWQNLVATVAAELPHAVRRPPNPGDEPKCTAAEAGPLLDCVKVECSTASGSELLGCALDKCSAETNSLSGGCADCLIQNIAKPVDELYAACVDPSAGGGDTALYGGEHDPGLLLRTEPLETDSLALSAYFVRAAVLYAKLPRPSGEPVHVFCTHFGSELDGIGYQGPHGSWEGEHAQQVAELLAYIQAKAPSGPVLVLGDLNTGPEQAGLSGEWPAHFTPLLESGLECPALQAEAPPCTLCPDNSFRSDTSSPRLIDHVLVRGLEARDIAVFANTPATVSVEGKPQSMSLSDHYGLRARVR
ncbi:MAG: hypothetical protein DYH12_36380 [Sorangiineae bacterium PRO1]|nr:hypothetical protein [Sorangiineae bacterium PRO1]